MTNLDKFLKIFCSSSGGKCREKWERKPAVLAADEIKKAWSCESKKEHDLHCREERKTGGGKAPASPSDVSKEVANVLPACVNPLKQEFDDDAGEELDLRRDKDEREVIKCEV